jgi:protein PsiE
MSPSVDREREKAERARRLMDRLAGTVGHFLVDAFHYLALFAIGGAIVWSAISSFWGMAAKGGASIEDILLLFIYLELGAMVGIYFKTNHMPVRFLIYVAITALTRMMIADVQEKHLHPDMGILLIAGGILLLALAILVIRYASHRFPSLDSRDTA